MEIASFSSGVIEVIKNFPTTSTEFLKKGSYVQWVYTYLLHSNRFLEIGYRKGLFLEICKEMGLESVHIDITDKLLRAVSTPRNKAITESSVDYLRTCGGKFDLIFQDGSKAYLDRIEEYRLISSKRLLKGYMIVDDLHYSGCDNAWDMALEIGFKKVERIEVPGVYSIGILRI